MKQVLVCLNCHADLSRDVQIEYGSVDVSWNKNGFPPAAVEEGLAIRHNTCKWSSEKQDVQQAQVVWMNLKDVQDHVGNFGSDLGCCGMTGIMPNRACSCGIGIGAEYSDCSGKHWFEANPETTFWMEFIAHNKTRERKRKERLESDKKSKKLCERDRTEKY